MGWLGAMNLIMSALSLSFIPEPNGFASADGRPEAARGAGARERFDRDSAVGDRRLQDTCAAKIGSKDTETAEDTRGCPMVGLETLLCRANVLTKFAARD